MEQVRGQGSSVFCPDSHSVAGSRCSCAIEIIAARHTWLIKAQYSGASLVAQTVKNPPAMRETRVPSLGQEHPLGKGTATHSSLLAWEIPWAEEPGGLQSVGSQKVGHD